MLQAVLTSDAQTDLREIARDTEHQWGADQAMRYAALLDACFDRIGNGTGMSRAFSEHYPTLRVARCEHHLVFFLAPPDGPPCVIAVLHERMDMLLRLKNRLS